jgi:hypothetical protein
MVKGDKKAERHYEASYLLVRLVFPDGKPVTRLKMIGFRKCEPAIDRFIAQIGWSSALVPPSWAILIGQS